MPRMKDEILSKVHFAFLSAGALAAGVPASIDGLRKLSYDLRFDCPGLAQSLEEIVSEWEETHWEKV